MTGFDVVLHSIRVEPHTTAPQEAQGLAPVSQENQMWGSGSDEVRFSAYGNSCRSRVLPYSPFGCEEGDVEVVDSTPAYTLNASLKLRCIVSCIINVVQELREAFRLRGSPGASDRE